MRFERGMDTQVRGDMVALGTGSTTVLPFARETKIVCALATDVVVA